MRLTSIGTGGGGLAWLDIRGAPFGGVIAEIALHDDPLVVFHLFVPDPIARL